MGPQVITEICQAGAAAIAAARLTSLRLGDTFPALLTYLVFDALTSLIFASLSPRSRAYFWVYIVSLVLEDAVSILAVRELVSLIFERYPGIRTLGRWTVYGGIVFAASTSLGAARFLSSAYPHRKWGLYYFQFAHRSVVFSLAIAIVAILFVLSKYPLSLGRNTYVSSAFFSAIFLSDALRLAIDSLTPQFFNHYADWTEAFIITGCLAAWAVMLRPEPAPAARVSFPTPVEERLLHQLDALNQLVTRAARQ